MIAGSGLRDKGFEVGGNVMVHGEEVRLGCYD